LQKIIILPSKFNVKLQKKIWKKFPISDGAERVLNFSILYTSPSLVLIVFAPRFDHLDFLPPLSPIKFAIWINNQREKQDYTFDLYVKPFAWTLWLAIFITACITAMFLTASEQVLIKRSINVLPSQLGHYLWAALGSNLGGKSRHWTYQFLF
jgi:hypothetical protein